MVVLAKAFDDLLTQLGIPNPDQCELAKGNLIAHYTENLEICVFLLISEYIFLEKTKVMTGLQQWKISTGYATWGCSVVHLVDPTSICD